MGLGLYTAVQRTTAATALPAYTHFFLGGEVGREYGVGLGQKLRLMRQVKRNATRITSATSWLEQLMLVSRVLSIPKSMAGDVVECGCFKGASTASLSLACELTGRKLVVCDSFEGLPEVAPHDEVHVSLEHRRYETYKKGEYRGALEEVKENVRRHGAIGVCEFVKGYFEDTLGDLGDRKFAFIFLDVDLHESLRTCLVHLWPRLETYGQLFTHEAQQLEYVARFFDRPWWQETFGEDPPGLIGAGSGVPIGMGGSGLGYAVKLPRDRAVTEDSYFKHFCGDPVQAGA